MLEHAGIERAILERAMLELELWTETHSLQQLAGPVAQTIAPVHKRALDAVSWRFANMPSPARATIAPLVSDIEHRILRTRGAGAERTLEQWTTTSNALSITDWLASFPCPRPITAEVPTTPVAPPNSANGDVTPDTDSWRLLALLILQHEPNPEPSTR